MGRARSAAASKKESVAGASDGRSAQLWSDADACLSDCSSDNVIDIPDIVHVAGYVGKAVTLEENHQRMPGAKIEINETIMMMNINMTIRRFTTQFNTRSSQIRIAPILDYCGQFCHEIGRP